MTPLDVLNTCAERFDSNWGVTTEIEWPNTTVNHTQIPFVRFNMNFRSENGTIGPSSRTKHTGFIVVQIFVKTNEGYKTAHDLAIAVFNIFENQQFNGVITYAGEVRTIGKDPDDTDLYVLNAQIPFDAL